MFELRMAGSAARARGAQERAEVLTELAEETRVVLGELRELAHGIFPAVLDEAGLDAALWTLADTAPVPLELARSPGTRLPQPVERAAYLVVAGAAERARGPLTVTLEHEEERGRLTVTVDGAARAPYVHLADRVGALGGRIVSEAGLLRAEIPYG